MIFEVPVLPDDPDRTEPWLSTSLEHIHYPTSTSLRYLFEQEVKVRLVGRVCEVVDFASVYVGLVSKAPELVERLAPEFNRWCSAAPSTLNPDEARFRWLFEIVHLAKSDPEVLPLNCHLKPSDLNLHIIRRLSELWATDIRRCEAAEATHREVAAYLAQVELARDWHANESTKKDAIIQTLTSRR
jgi:hypothetical protein